MAFYLLNDPFVRITGTYTEASSPQNFGTFLASGNDAGKLQATLDGYLVIVSRKGMKQGSLVQSGTKNLWFEFRILQLNQNPPEPCTYQVVFRIELHIFNR